MPESSSPPRRRDEPRPRDEDHSCGRRREQLDPDSVGILDVGEERSSFAERAQAGTRARIQQLAIRRFDVLALEGDVVQLVAVPLRAFEERGAFGVPVQLQDLLRIGAPKLRPLPTRLRNPLAARHLHPQRLLIEADGSIHVPHLDSEVRELVPHANRHGNLTSAIRPVPSNGGA